MQTLFFVGIIVGDDFTIVNDAGIFDTQKLVCRAVKNLSQPGQCGDVRAGLVVFPFAHRLGCDTQLIRQLILCQLHLFTQGDDPPA